MFERQINSKSCMQNPSLRVLRTRFHKCSIIANLVCGLLYRVHVPVSRARQLPSDSLRVVGSNCPLIHYSWHNRQSRLYIKLKCRLTQSRPTMYYRWVDMKKSMQFTPRTEQEPNCVQYEYLGTRTCRVASLYRNTVFVTITLSLGSRSGYPATCMF